MLAETKGKLRVMLVSIVPPRNDCGVRIVMHRHLVERAPFELHVASNADFAEGLLVHTKLELPSPFQKIKKSRLGLALKKWILDFENLVWPLVGCRKLEAAVREFRPDVILTLAETGLCYIAYKVARKHRIPVAALFLDWFPIMESHYGHKWTQGILSRRFRRLYQKVDLAICTSDGMKEVLGSHANSHVVYPMPGRHPKVAQRPAVARDKFTLLYVGRAEGSYGRALAELAQVLRGHATIRLRIVSPVLGWPAEERIRAESEGVYLGFKPPNEAAQEIGSADALLVTMPFDESEKLFMQTSFTTKFLDYSAFAKPIVLWGPEYCSPVGLARRLGGALVVTEKDAGNVEKAVAGLARSPDLQAKLAEGARSLHETVFDPDRLQGIFENEMSRIARVG